MDILYCTAPLGNAMDFTQICLDKIAFFLADNIFKCVFQISMTFIPNSVIDNEVKVFQLSWWLGAVRKHANLF